MLVKKNIEISEEMYICGNSICSFDYLRLWNVGYQLNGIIDYTFNYVDYKY